MTSVNRLPELSPGKLSAPLYKLAFLTQLFLYDGVARLGNFLPPGLEELDSTFAS